MAVTGLIMFLFVVVHLLGNTTIFMGADGINAYAEHLHALGPLVWIFRLVLLVVFVLHITYGIQLTLENRSARPISYSLKEENRTTFAASTMIYTGLALLAFIVYHLLHFTVQVTNPEISAGALPPDALGRPDVFSMVVLSFQKFFITLIYVAAMVVLLLHLSHGVQSFVQTMGWNNAKSLSVMERISKAVAIVLLVGFGAIPLSILLGLVNV